MAKKVADYGSWESPISSRQLVGGNCKTISELRVSSKGRPLWLEQTFPHGKKVLFEQTATDRIIQRSPSDISVTNSVHEYGGGSLCFGAAGAAEGRLFVCHSGGIWELTEPGVEPKPIVRNGPGEDVRHADICAHGHYVYAVQEIHSSKKGNAAESTEPKNRLVRIHLQSGQCQVLSEEADFYAEPRVSPDGHWLAWIQWDNPYMSWENTSVHVLDLGEEGEVGQARTILDNGRSNFALAWSRDSRLWTLSDIEGRWNVHLLDHSTKAEGIIGKGLIPAHMGEIGDPLWLFDMDRPFVMLGPNGSGAIVAVGETLWMLSGDRAPSRFDSVHQLGFTSFHQLCLTPKGDKLFCLASGPQRAISLVQLDLSVDPYTVTIVREARPHSELSELPISVGESLTFVSDSITVQGYFYPPFSHTQTAPPGQLPPALLLVHGGPTARTTNALDLKIQFFTSRGFAVFDINYRGSSGFGREFRNYLNGQWGVVDRNDMINGANFLISTGRANPKRVCIMGGSAGGFTALSVLMHPDKVFAAAVSIYGVSDLEALYKVSHKFEKENTAKLIAPYPEGLQIYRERSPLHNIHLVDSPVAFLHGTDDPVVPVEQSKECHRSVKAKGVPTLLKLFPGEGHGFKKADSIAQAMDISYFFLCKVMGIPPSGNLQLEIDNI